MKAKKITIDKKANAAYIYLKKGRVHKSVPYDNSVILDFDKKGDVLGIELLNLSKLIKAVTRKRLLIAA